MKSLLALLAAATLLASACGGSPGVGATPAPSRPASTAVLSIVQPQDGPVITGNKVHIVLAVTGATVVVQTNNHIVPDQGHAHVYLNGKLIYMDYTLQQDVPVSPGTYVLSAEFVANDHYPFHPRDWAKSISFTVQAA
jgi:hypothetical protein